MSASLCVFSHSQCSLSHSLSVHSALCPLQPWAVLSPPRPAPLHPCTVLSPLTAAPSSALHPLHPCTVLSLPTAALHSALSVHFWIPALFLSPMPASGSQVPTCFSLTAAGLGTGSNYPPTCLSCPHSFIDVIHIGGTSLATTSHTGGEDFQLQRVSS